MAQPNWKKIAKEYITTDIAMRPLAAKYNVPLRTMADRSKKEKWTQRRNEYRLNVGTQAVATPAATDVPKPATKDVTEAKLIFEGATLAINWIVRRLESDDLEDWREVEGLVRALNGTKAITKIRMALEEQEQRARIANLEQQTAKAAREPVEITFAGTEDAAR